MTEKSTCPVWGCDHPHLRSPTGTSIPKPDLVDLMNLFIGWGMSILKKKWLDRVGCK